MRTVGRTFTGQKAGGPAAPYLAAAYLLAIPFFLIVVAYLSVTDPTAKVALLVANHGSIRLMHAGERGGPFPSAPVSPTGGHD